MDGTSFSFYEIVIANFDGQMPPLHPDQIGRGKKRDLPDGHASGTDIVDMLEARAREFFAMPQNQNSQAMFPPRVIACCANGDVVHFKHPEQFEPEDRQRWSQAMRFLLRRWGVKHYAMICEAWAAVADPEEATSTGRLRETSLPPSERPDRKEVIAIMGGDRRGRVLGRTLEMIRGEAGAVIELRRLPMMEGLDDTAIARGRFANLLSDEDPIAEDSTGTPLHPTEDAENVQTYQMAMQLLSMMHAAPLQGEAKVALVKRANDAAQGLALAWERLKQAPMTKGAIEPLYADLGRALVQAKLIVEEAAGLGRERAASASEAPGSRHNADNDPVH